jgi:hypothetical protein
MEKPEYHFCFIGPFCREELDRITSNGEGSIRAANQNAFHRLTKQHADTCSSGWGVTPKQKNDATFYLRNDELRDAVIQSYFNESKPLPSRAYTAWMLLRESEGHVFRK